jgi:hypothetical protein
LGQPGVIYGGHDTKRVSSLGEFKRDPKPYAVSSDLSGNRSELVFSIQWIEDKNSYCAEEIVIGWSSS